MKLENEITGSALTAQQQLIVMIGRGRSYVNSLSAASAVYREYIESHDLGASKAPSCVVKNAEKVIADISYNGRVWAR